MVDSVPEALTAVDDHGRPVLPASTRRDIRRKVRYNAQLDQEHGGDGGGAQDATVGHSNDQDGAADPTAGGNTTTNPRKQKKVKQRISARGRVCRCPTCHGLPPAPTMNRDDASAAEPARVRHARNRDENGALNILVNFFSLVFVGRLRTLWQRQRKPTATTGEHGEGNEQSPEQGTTGADATITDQSAASGDDLVSDPQRRARDITAKSKGALIP